MKGSFAGVLALVVVECRAPREAFRAQRTCEERRRVTSPFGGSLVPVECFR
jgi:hypothetical protein